jgi:hypothetical protein
LHYSSSFNTDNIRSQATYLVDGSSAEKKQSCYPKDHVQQAAAEFLSVISTHPKENYSTTLA